MGQGGGDPRPSVHRSDVSSQKLFWIAGTPYRLTADATLASRIGRPSPPRGLPRGGGTPDPSDLGEIPILGTDPDPGSVMHRWKPCRESSLICLRDGAGGGGGGGGLRG